MALTSAERSAVCATAPAAQTRSERTAMSVFGMALLPERVGEAAGGGAPRGSPTGGRRRQRGDGGHGQERERVDRRDAEQQVADEARDRERPERAEREPG